MKVKNYAFAGFMAAILSGTGAMAADNPTAGNQTNIFKDGVSAQADNMVTSKAYVDVQDAKRVAIFQGTDNAGKMLKVNGYGMLELSNLTTVDAPENNVTAVTYNAGTNTYTVATDMTALETQLRTDGLYGADKGVKYDSANNKFQADLKANGGIDLDGNSMYVKVDGTTIVNDNGTLKATATDQTASGAGTTVNADHTVDVNVDGTGIVIDSNKVSLKLANGDATEANGNKVDVQYDGTTIKKNAAGKLYVDTGVVDTNTTYTAGTNVQISTDGVISATDTTYTAGDFVNIDADNKITTTYKAGTNINIATDGTISATDTNTTYTAGDGIDTIGTDNVIKAKVQNGNITTATADANGIKVDVNLGNGVNAGTNGLEVKAQNGDATVASVDANGVKVDVQYDGTTIKKNSAGKLYVNTTVDTNVSGKSTWTTTGVISSMQESWTTNKCDEKNPCALVTDASGNPVWQRIAQIDTSVPAQGLTSVEVNGIEPEVGETAGYPTGNAGVTHTWQI